MMLDSKISDFLLTCVFYSALPSDFISPLSHSLIAISKVCKEFGFVRPVLTTDKVLSIKQGRHPLHAAICDSFVPNDFESSQEAGLVKILTGPNSSGKSVYMKQIGEHRFCC